MLWLVQLPFTKPIKFSLKSLERNKKFTHLQQIEFSRILIINLSMPYTIEGRCLNMLSLHFKIKVETFLMYYVFFKLSYVWTS